MLGVSEGDLPLYEYQCPKCGRFEIIQRFADAALSSCPTCGAEVQKLPSAPAIQFKGTGWYITDYARKSSGSAGAEKGGDAAKASSDAAPKAASPSGESSSKGGSSSGGSSPATK